jgi:hypothetical protein
MIWLQAAKPNMQNGVPNVTTTENNEQSGGTQAESGRGE